MTEKQTFGERMGEATPFTISMGIPYDAATEIDLKNRIQEALNSPASDSKDNYNPSSFIVTPDGSYIDTEGVFDSSTDLYSIANNPTLTSDSSGRTMRVTGAALTTLVLALGGACDNADQMLNQSTVDNWSLINQRDVWLYDASTGNLLEDEVGLKDCRTRYSLFQEYGDNWEDSLNVRGIEAVPVQPPAGIRADTSYRETFPPR
ncbi:MAG: hypothetical protein KAQ83_04345 [Nanoarchaeota archaeon]|nr:hypothetical protein [Nanoarchaeota archaeon]